MSGKVLDSFALLAFLSGEPGEEAVNSLLERAATKGLPIHMSEVNYAEVRYIVLRKQGAVRWEEIAAGLSVLPILFHAATRQLADMAADFKYRHKMSLADAFAAALCKQERAELVTNDPEFKALEKELKIYWLT